MPCPTCKQIVARKDNPFRPFCSERCKLIDFANWIEGRYRVPAHAEPIDENGRERTTGSLEEEHA